MYDAMEQAGITVVRGLGELGRAELAGIAALATRARREGRLVVIDLARVTHLHYGGAALLKAVPGLRATQGSSFGLLGYGALLFGLVMLISGIIQYVTAPS